MAEVTQEQPSQEAPAENVEAVVQPEEGNVEAAPEQPAEASPEMKDAVKSTLKKLNIKVDGKEIEKQIDLANEEELIRMVQLAEMSQKRAQKAAELEKKDAKVQKDLQDFFNYLQKDTANALRKMGIDIDGLSEKIMNDKLEKAQLDPKDRELMELQEKLRQKEEEEQKAKKRAEEIEMKALQDRYAAEYQRDLMAAIEKNQLPMNPEIINRMTGYMRIALKNNIDVSFNDIVPLVKDQILNEIKSIASVMPLEVIEKLLGEDKVGQIIKKRKKAEPVKKEAPPTSNSIKDTGSKPNKEVIDRKFKTIEQKDFWSKI
ncbi:MAG TPA: hypothetical protein VI911_08890 [Patescibacteria group bacterium]|nr:MAG: hypothetical protein UR43_C0005G0054 [candidate division TM6 bacterium GW2011_GWF2_33_332]HLD91113.1 hypothetical protein [Patescibacteria group bacterium]